MQRGQEPASAATAQHSDWAANSAAGRRLLLGGRQLHTFRWWRQLLGGQAAAASSQQGTEPDRSIGAAQPAVQALDGSSGQPAAQRLVAVRPPAPSTAAVIAAAVRNLGAPLVADGQPTQLPAGPGEATTNGGITQPTGAAAAVGGAADAATAGGGAVDGAAAGAASGAAAAVAGAAPEGGQPPFNGACPPPTPAHHTLPTTHSCVHLLPAAELPTTRHGPPPSSRHSPLYILPHYMLS
jgi:hypothetical protein